MHMPLHLQNVISYISIEITTFFHGKKHSNNNDDNNNIVNFIILEILAMWDVLWGQCFDAYRRLMPVGIYQPFNLYGWASYYNNNILHIVEMWLKQ